MINPELPSICVIISSKELPEKLEILLKAGIRWIQYREKDLPRKEIVEKAFQVRYFTHKYRALLTINDYLDIAIAVKADGVHLGQDDIPLEVAKKIFSGIIGISTHNLQEAHKAQNGGASYIGFGPVFYTTTKDNALEPRGYDMLSLICKKISIPVVAIGGIKKEKLVKLRASGCRYIAVASGILEGDVMENAKAFLKVFP